MENAGVVVVATGFGGGAATNCLSVQAVAAAFWQAFQVSNKKEASVCDCED